MESSLQLAMKLDPREVNHHLRTILQQIEVTRFFNSCEAVQHHVMDLIPELLHVLQTSAIPGTKLQTRSVPTLFGPNTECAQVAALAILCGRDVEEGFGLAFRLVNRS
jgi:zinc finger FYVE domain-containing protein 26